MSETRIISCDGCDERITKSHYVLTLREWTPDKWNSDACYPKAEDKHFCSLACVLEYAAKYTDCEPSQVERMRELFENYMPTRWW